jgi:hypothetical protein
LIAKPELDGTLSCKASRECAMDRRNETVFRTDPLMVPRELETDSELETDPERDTVTETDQKVSRPMKSDVRSG